MAGTAAGKGVACTAADVQLCYKTCGPEKTGVKPETCTRRRIRRGRTACSTPARTYACYAVPASAGPDLSDHGADGLQPLLDRRLRGLRGRGTTDAADTGTGYTDSTGAAKTGYCVCQASAAAPSWSCASSTAWPCPNGSGC